MTVVYNSVLRQTDEKHQASASSLRDLVKLNRVSLSLLLLLLLSLSLPLELFPSPLECKFSALKPLSLKVQVSLQKSIYDGLSMALAAIKYFPTFTTFIYLRYFSHSTFS